MANVNDETAKMMPAISMLRLVPRLRAEGLGSIGVGLAVDNDGGMHIDTRALFVPNAPGGRRQRIRALRGPQLACLPSGNFMIAFGGAMPKSFSKSFLNRSAQMMNQMSKAAGGKEMTEEQSKQLTI